MKSVRLIGILELLAPARARLILAGALLAVSTGWAQTIHVDVNTGDDARTGAGDWTNAVKTISNGVFKAGASGTVLVATGRYEVVSNIVITAGITVRSWNNGELDPTNTVVDGQGAVRGLYMSHNDAWVAGFTFTNGNGRGDRNSNYGGGVYLRRGTISNCIVAGNSANERGGGLYNENEGAYSLITDCTILGNVQTNEGSATNLIGGGGVYLRTFGILRNSRILSNEAKQRTAYYGGGGVLWTTTGNSVGEISGCTIASNTAYVYGGGVSLSDRAPAGLVFRRNDIYGNSIVGSASQRRGGGLAVSRPFIGFVIDSCRIVSNTCTSFGSGLGIGGDAYNNENGLTITNCTISYNSGAGAAIARQWGGEAGATNNLYDYRIMNSILEYNTNTATTSGGAVGFEYAGIWIEGCRFRGNNASDHGGVYFGGVTTNAPFVLRNCLIIGNKARAGTVGGCNIIANGWVDNCTIVSNNAVTAPGGLFVDGGAVSNTICYYNAAPAHPDWTGAGQMGYNCFSTNASAQWPTIITNAPMFTDTEYRLSANSPCVNAGLTQDWMHGAFDLDGRARIDRFSRLVDMGCHEYLSQGAMYRVR